MNRDNIQEKIEKLEFILKSKDNIDEQYMRLNKAIYQNQSQSIIKLSKVITRYHMGTIWD